MVYFVFSFWHIGILRQPFCLRAFALAILLPELLFPCITPLLTVSLLQVFQQTSF